ncbi:MAG: hypothetical protein EOQ95_23245 [Mesorhizobium sp.]|nr:MAG: hypothetical protein EOR23_33490 [Mesorhizobium sp.]RWO85898.1 MAG: hypothetical protein EOQ95_23245 [Mesorhizobium sp.]
MRLEETAAECELHQAPQSEPCHVVAGVSRPTHSRITKQGRAHARSMLVDAAWSFPACLARCGAFMRIRDKRGKARCRVAAARKLAVINGRLAPCICRQQ